MSESEATGYVGPAEIRDAAIVGVFGEGSILRVILGSEAGPRLTLTFRDVSGVVEKRAEGMKLAGLTRSPAGGRQRFVFANRDKADDARLEVTASGFEVGSSP